MNSVKFQDKKVTYKNQSYFCTLKSTTWNRNKENNPIKNNRNTKMLKNNLSKVKDLYTENYNIDERNWTLMK